MTIRMIVSDLDGTLLNEEGIIPPETAEVIRRTQQCGVKWVIATGRSMTTAKPILNNANIQCDCILLNGAEYRDAEGAIILQEKIEEKTSKDVIELLEKYKIDFEINTSEGDFATDCRFCVMDLPMPEMDELKTKEYVIRKFFIFSKIEKKLSAVKRELQSNPEITVTSSSSWNIEITGACAQKGMMLQKVIKYYGIAKEQVLVFGDGENDISLFQSFPHSRAMKNATIDIQSMAEKVVDTNVKQGVALEVKATIKELNW